MLGVVSSLPHLFKSHGQSSQIHGTFCRSRTAGKARQLHPTWMYEDLRYLQSACSQTICSPPGGAAHPRPRTRVGPEVLGASGASRWLRQLRGLRKFPSLGQPQKTVLAENRKKRTVGAVLEKTTSPRPPACATPQTHTGPREGRSGVLDPATAEENSQPESSAHTNTTQHTPQPCPHRASVPEMVH